MFGVQKFGEAQANQLFKLYPIEDSYQVAKFDISLFLRETAEGIIGNFNYAISLFKRETVERLKDHYIHILEQITESTNKSIKAIEVLSKEEYQTIVYDWNQTDRDYPKDKTIYQLFEEQVKANPDNIALVFEEQALSYNELNNRANQLARYIRQSYKQGTQAELKPDTLIALCLDRSLEMVISILAVMKAGGAYVPIDPEYPEDRIGYILEDTQAKIVLTQKWHEEKLSAIKNNFNNESKQNKQSIRLVDVNVEAINNEQEANLEQYSQSIDLAYVIYTSGTTGKPKGVMVAHKSLANRLVWQKDAYRVDSKSIILQKTPYIFDVSVWELLLPYISGSCLVVAKPNGHKDSEYIYELIQNKNITQCHFVPSMLQSFLMNIKNKNGALQLALKNVVCSGEALSSQVARIFKDIFANIALHNLYGPTEAAIDVSHSFDIDNIETIHIGKPIQNTSLYVLDLNNHPVPIGVVGELHIGGVGLARGYLNRPELTAEKFIPNPFATESDIQKGYTRLYKTGDLVRWLPDGNLEYIGRNDDQVKIRGFRIELGEIENILSNHQTISQVTVLTKERATDSGSSKYLVAYYVPNNNNLEDYEPIGEDGLRLQLKIEDKDDIEEQLIAHCNASLPEYMVPSFFVAVSHMPLTVNGKLDKRSLLEIDASINQDSYVAPRNELADELCKLYAEVLGLEQVGITDDFFRVGGNSILAIQLSHKVSKALSVDVKVADIFQYRTVKTISGYIVQDAHSSIVIPKVEQSEYVLSFAQERLWFIEQYEQGTNAYHIPMVVELLADTDIKVLEQALEAIANRHQVLKSVFKINDAGQDVQIIGRAPLSIITKSYIDKEKLNLQIQEDINRVFDLRASYPIRVVSYIQENNAEQGSKQDNEPKRYLLINIHHIAFDGWSTDILLKELNQIYNNLKVGKVTYAGLNELSIQYKDFALWQREFLHGEILSEQVDYWKGRLDGIEPLALPLDYPRPHQIDYTGDNIDFSLDKQLSDSLIQFTKEKGYTLYSTLLTAFYILLNKYTSQEDIVIGTPIANRHYAQIEDLIGFFVNSLALPQHVHSEATVGELFEQVHERLIEAQCYQDIPFEKLVEALKVERDQRS